MVFDVFEFPCVGVGGLGEALSIFVPDISPFEAQIPLGSPPFATPFVSQSHPRNYGTDLPFGPTCRTYVAAADLTRPGAHLHKFICNNMSSAESNRIALN